MSISNMGALIEASGYEIKDMKENVFYKPLKELEIATMDFEKNEKVFKKVNGVVYKGMSDGYNVVTPSETFMCTKNHKFYSVEKEDYVKASDLGSSFIGLSNEGKNVEIFLEKTEKQFSVLDIEVDGLSTYFSGGILSHNTFGGGAKVFAEGLKALNPYLSRHGCSMIMVSQERASMSLYGSDTKTTGGYAPKYYSSWRGRITRVDDIKVKGEKVGIVSKVRTIKSKIGVPGREAELHLNFDHGFDSDMEYLTFLVDLGIVEKRGAWFYQEDWGFKGQGKDSVKEFLFENPDIFEQIKNTVNVMLAGVTDLDKDNVLDENEEEEEVPMRGAENADAES